MNILFLAARFPYPPLKGDQVRAYHQLRLLSRNHRITLLAFADSGLPTEAQDALAPFCARIVTVPPSRAAMAASLARGPLSPYPLQTLLYQAPAMARTLAATLAEERFDLAHVQLARMAPYLETAPGLPRVVDLIDALSLNMRRRARREWGPLRWATRLEYRRLARYERQICRAYDAVTVVSPVDRRAIGDYPNLYVNPLGVDQTAFPYDDTPRQGETLVFTGNMGYFPNINAVTWFARQVLPLVQQRVPGVRFEVVGANPPDSIRQLVAQNPAIEVTGYVADLAAHLRRAAVAVAPMQAGSGMQFKVLEAMACGTPVVATPYALGGVAATPDRDLLLAADAPAFAAAVVRLLEDAALRRQLAQAAYRLIEERYTWQRSVRQLEAIYDQVRSGLPG